MGGSDPGDEVDFILDDDAEITIYEAEISPELVIEETPEPDPAPEFAYEWNRVYSNGRDVIWPKEGDIWLIKRDENDEARRMPNWDFAQ